MNCRISTNGRAPSGAPIVVINLKFTHAQDVGFNIGTTPVDTHRLLGAAVAGRLWLTTHSHSTLYYTTTSGYIGDNVVAYTEIVFPSLTLKTEHRFDTYYHAITDAVNDYLHLSPHLLAAVTTGEAQHEVVTA